MYFIQTGWRNVSLGMGDITTLVEKAQEQFDEEQARKLEKDPQEPV